MGFEQYAPSIPLRVALVLESCRTATKAQRDGIAVLGPWSEYGSSAIGYGAGGSMGLEGEGGVACLVHRLPGEGNEGGREGGLILYSVGVESRL